jgi:hypothetical protein
MKDLSLGYGRGAGLTSGVMTEFSAFAGCDAALSKEISAMNT